MITYFFGQQTMNCLSVRKSYKSIRLEDKTMIKKSLESITSTYKNKNKKQARRTKSGQVTMIRDKTITLYKRKRLTLILPQATLHVNIYLFGRNANFGNCTLKTTHS